MAVSTPLSLSAWEGALASHPDPAYACYICQGLRWDFRVGFQCISPLKSASSNMGSAHQHPHVVLEYLRIKCNLGRMLGPFQDPLQLPSVISRFGVIPKGHNTGKFRLITDLSFPLGQSVNDGIDPGLCSLVYTSVDEVASEAAIYGRGALLAKVDIEAAYRLIPCTPKTEFCRVCSRGV